MILFLQSRFRPNAVWVYASVAPALILVAANVDRNYQTDLWHHLARGREIVNHGELLNHDIFTYTVSGKTFQDPNWLTQVCFYELFHHSGDSLAFLQVVNATLLTITLALSVWHTQRSSQSWRLAALLGIMTFLGLWQLILIRPQTLSLLLFVFMYVVLDLAECQPHWLLVPPVLMALWANLHGAFPIGLVLIGVFAFAHLLTQVSLALRDGSIRRSATTILAPVFREPMTRYLLLCLAASALATLVNPYGWHLYEYVGGTSATSAERRIDEWVPPGPRLLIGKVWLASIVLTLAAVALSPRRPTIRQVCLLICFLLLSSTAARMVAWWLLIAAPILAAQLAAALPGETIADTDADRQPTVGDGAIWTVLLVSMILSLPALERFNPLLTLAGRSGRVEDNVQAVADRIQQDSETGRIFSRFDWGEYLGWSLTPNYTVFMDGRIEIIPDAVWEEYEAVNDTRHDWQAILDRYQVTHLVLDDRHHQLLLEQALKSGGWRQVLESGPAHLLVRRH